MAPTSEENKALKEERHKDPMDTGEEKSKTTEDATAPKEVCVWRLNSLQIKFIFGREERGGGCRKIDFETLFRNASSETRYISDKKKYMYIFAENSGRTQ